MLPLPLRVTLPDDGWLMLMTLSGSPSGSESLSSTAIVTATPGAVVALSASAIGGWLRAMTLTVTLALSLPPRPSLML